MFLLRHVAATWAPRLAQRQVEDVVDRVFLDQAASASGALLALGAVLPEARYDTLSCRCCGAVHGCSYDGKGKGNTAGEICSLDVLTHSSFSRCSHTQQRRALRRLLSRATQVELLGRALMEQQVSLMNDVCCGVANGTARSYHA